MALDVGSRLGHYNVTALIGEGGMGQVYQATDTKLNRQVALKILPEAFASDPERLARFQREAQVLASLNHPGIAAIHGIEESDGQQALVLELVEGPTLADRIAKGPIPLDEALPLAKQIAEALEAAHEAGVIHRDLKPANIKVKDDGTVKVLDFGLAKALDPTPEGDPSQSPTLTAAATQMGVIMGTAAYMSPEQARGKPVDKRADIWAFGCVLYELLTGRMAFQGEDVSLTLSAVLQRAPDWEALPPGLPVSLVHYLRRCLEKGSLQRVRDIGDMRLALEGAFDVGTSATRSGSPQVERRRGAVLGAAAVLFALAVGGLTVWTITQPDPLPVSRFTVQVPTNPGPFADVLSPDGHTIAFANDYTTARRPLYIRRLDEAEAVPLTGADGFTPYAFSPDGDWLLVADGSVIKKLPLRGGQGVTIADDLLGVADWGPDNMIVVGSAGQGGLMSVLASGGEARQLLAPAEGHGAYVVPRFLPSGRAVLFYLADAATGELHVAVYDFDTEQMRSLLPGSSPQFVPTGHIVFHRDDSLWAAPFNQDRLELTGEARPVVQGMDANLVGWANYSVAHDGTLVYRPTAEARPSASLVTVDERGNEEQVGAPPGEYRTVRLSPDGTRIATEMGDGDDSDVWVYHLENQTAARVTFGTSFDIAPVWTPDGDHVVFSSLGDGANGLYRKPADGTGEVELLWRGTDFLLPASFSPDGRTLLVTGQRSETTWDIGVLSLNGEAELEWLLETEAAETDPSVSPDGGWLAYVSSESGQPEVYVRPFPNVTEGLWQISTDGGRDPVWGRDGKELLYQQPVPTGTVMMRTPVETAASFSSRTASPVFEGPYRGGGLLFQRHQFDYSRADQRFLMIREPEAELPSNIFVQNWFEELTRLVPSP